MIDYSDKQIQDLTKFTNEAEATAKKSIEMLSSIMTPEIKDSMTPRQSKFVTDANSLFNNKSVSMSDKMEGLQELMKRGENII